MPELPDAKRYRFVAAFGLTPYDAGLLTASRELAQYYEAASEGLSGSSPKLVANWVTGALAARLNEAGCDIAQSKVAPGQLRALVERVADETLSSKTAREVFEALWAGEGEVDAIIERRGLRQISDSSELDRLADEVLASNAAQVADYQAGKAKAFNALVGRVMKASKGKANPQQVNEILRRKLGTPG
jgi:aspartyl-tRNA(Asn)/glutamyl-tRNA(Gln) amidotransferase subunit B